MDTSSTLMGVGLLLVFLAPILYLIFDQSRREKRRKKELFSTAQTCKLNLNNYDLLQGLSIGIDKSSEKLLVICCEKEHKPQVIQLDKLTRVTLEKKYYNGPSSPSLDDMKELTLFVEDKEKQIGIPFFRSEVDSVTEKELRLQKAQHWENLLCQTLEKSYSK